MEKEEKIDVEAVKRGFDAVREDVEKIKGSVRVIGTCLGIAIIAVGILALVG